VREDGVGKFNVLFVSLKQMRQDFLVFIQRKNPILDHILNKIKLNQVVMSFNVYFCVYFGN
jgi:hypothetical protein